jgi:hypothetical protein
MFGVNLRRWSSVMVALLSVDTSTAHLSLLAQQGRFVCQLTALGELLAEKRGIHSKHTAR